MSAIDCRDEFQDDHTRAVVVRGSSNYRPNGSKWYFPPALELNKHNKYFLMGNRRESNSGLSQATLLLFVLL